MRDSDRPTRQVDAETAAKRAAEPADAYADIVALARRSASRHSFITGALRHIAIFFSSPYSAVYVRYSSEVLQDDWHTGPSDPQFWKPGLQQFLTESLAETKARAKLLRAKSGKTKIAFLSAPIFDPSGPAIGAVAVVIAPIEDTDVANRLTTLEALARLTSFSAEFIGLRAADARSGDKTLAAFARGGACTSAEQFAFTITNELCNKTDCEQVSLALTNGPYLRIVSISGLDDVRRQSSGVVHIRAAMEECLDAKVPIGFQRESSWSEDDSGPRYRLHKKWHAAAKGDSVASIPLRQSDSIVAILSLRRRADQPFSKKQIEDIRTSVEAYVPSLLLAQRASRSMVRHAWENCCETAQTLLSPGNRGKKLLTVVGIFAALVFFFGSAPYDVTVPCRVTPALIRHVSSPYSGVIDAAYVTEGDRVTAGDPLCSLKQQEMVQRRAELVAELTVLQREYDRATAADSPVEAQLALAQQDLVRTKLDIVQTRLDKATVRAPIDGIVVEGDLRKRIGSVVERGEPLFQVAAAKQWKLELEVPEAVSADLASGLSGSFASYAKPDVTQAFTVTRVFSTAQIRNARNVYLAEGAISESSGDASLETGAWIRPGMEGVAKMHIGPRPIWWIALHRAIDYLRMNLWL